MRYFLLNHFIKNCPTIIKRCQIYYIILLINNSKLQVLNAINLVFVSQESSNISPTQIQFNVFKTMLFFFKFDITFYPYQFSTLNNPLSKCQKILQFNSIAINKNNSSTHLKTNISEIYFFNALKLTFILMYEEK